MPPTNKSTRSSNFLAKGPMQAKQKPLRIPPIAIVIPMLTRKKCLDLTSDNNSDSCKIECLAIEGCFSSNFAQKDPCGRLSQKNLLPCKVLFLFPKDFLQFATSFTKFKNEELGKFVFLSPWAFKNQYLAVRYHGYQGS